MRTEVDGVPERPERHGMLLGLSNALRELGDPVEVSARASEMIADWLEVDRAYYVEIDDDLGIATVARDFVRDGMKSLVGEHHVADFGWSVQILRRGECHVVGDTRTSDLVHDDARPASAALEIIACICAPLIKEGRLVGALCVTDSDPRDWRDEDVSLLRDAADLIWTAVERARAEAALGISEARYRTLVDSMDEAVCVFERLPRRPDGLRDYRYITMNPAMQAMFGIADLSGQSIRDNFPDEAEEWYDDYDHVLETGEAVRIERGSMPQGMVLEMFVSRITDDSQRRLMAVIRDVTAQRRAEAELRARQAREEFLLRLTDRLRYLDEPGEVMKTACDMLGAFMGVDRVNYVEIDGVDCTTAQEYLRSDLPPMTPIFTSPGFRPDGADSRHTGRSLVVEDIEAQPGVSQEQLTAYRALAIRAFISAPLLMDGQQLVVLSVANAAPTVWTRDEVALVEEVAERSWSAIGRAQAEAALRASEQRFRALVNATSEVVYRMSPDWSVMRELDGRGFIKDAPEPTTDWFTDYIPPEEADRVAKAIQQAIDGKETFKLEHRVKRPDGSLGWTLSRAIPMLDDAGNIVEWFGAASNITARREAVEALVHSQRLDVVGRLAGSIAHDFNNLLTVIVANIEMAQIRGDAETRNTHLDKAMRAAQLGERLNNRLVVWSKSGPVRPQLVDLNGLVRQLGSILDRAIGERIRLDLDLAPDLWPAFIDPAYVDSAILNLAVNGRDAMPRGGTISVVTSNEAIGTGNAATAIPGDYVCLSVADTGEGMTPDVLARALDPFFTTKEHGTGAGLGLFSVQTMVRECGGFLQIDSTPGRGTTVRLYLPRGHGDGTSAIETRRSETVAGDGKGVILVVEDQAPVRDAARERLHALGYGVVEARDAHEALVCLEHNADIQLVFTDIVMPGEFNGRDLAQRILTDYPGLPVVMTTGYSGARVPPDDDDPTAGIEVLTKPYSLHALSHAIARAMHRTGRAHGA
jgi:PAS domain S-box-containing protein